MNIDQPENKIINFLRINKKIFAYTTIIILIILAAFIFFLNNSDKEKTKISEKYYYAKVLLNNGQNEEAKEILSNLVLKKNSAYSSLALFEIIENQLIENKEQIFNYFDFILENNSYEKEDINLIKLKKAIYISDIKKEQEITKLLSPIINSNSVWKQHALKFLGDFYSSNQQIEKAKQYYSLININNNNDKQK